MALSKKGLILVLTSAVLCVVSLGAVHNVGDSSGWTTMVKVDYAKWAASQKLLVGDTIVFNYNKNFHNVMQVTLPAYRSCNASSPIATYTSGSDSITIKKTGHMFFLCGVPGHCEAGQKVDIRVLSASPSPSSSPSSAPIGSPKASPSLALAPAPAPAAQSDAPLLNTSKLWLAFGLSLAALMCFAY